MSDNEARCPMCCGIGRWSYAGEIESPCLRCAGAGFMPVDRGGRRPEASLWTCRYLLAGREAGFIQVEAPDAATARLVARERLPSWKKYEMMEPVAAEHPGPPTDCKSKRKPRAGCVCLACKKARETAEGFAARDYPLTTADLNRIVPYSGR